MSNNEQILILNTSKASGIFTGKIQPATVAFIHRHDNGNLPSAYAQKAPDAEDIALMEAVLD